MRSNIDGSDFINEVMRSKKYLIINGAASSNGAFIKTISFFYILVKGIAISIFVPIAWTIMPAVINYTGQEWLYGVFITGAFIGYLYTKFVSISKTNILNSLANAVESWHIFNDKNRDVFSKSIDTESKNIKIYAASLCDGNFRDENKIRWIEPVIGLLILIYFINNPEITIMSMEYVNFLLAMVLVLFDVFIGGLLGSFSELTNWVPKMNIADNGVNSVIIGLLRFFIVIFMTKFLIDKLKIQFSHKLWFEGNDIGLWLYMEKYMNAFLEKEGSVIVYDFGLKDEFGKNKASILLNNSIKKRSEKLFNKIISMAPSRIKEQPINDSKLDFHELHFKNITLTNNRYFQEGDLALDVARGDDFPTIYHYNRIVLTSVSRVRYNTAEQKLYFVDEHNGNIDSGIMVLFPSSIIVEMSEKIHFVHVSDRGLLPPVSFVLDKDGFTEINSNVLKSALWGISKRKLKKPNK